LRRLGTPGIVRIRCRSKDCLPQVPLRPRFPIKNDINSAA
jgi:hypothetical protein